MHRQHIVCTSKQLPIRESDTLSRRAQWTSQARAVPSSEHNTNTAQSTVELRAPNKSVQLVGPWRNQIKSSDSRGAAQHRDWDRVEQNGLSPIFLSKKTPYMQSTPRKIDNFKLDFVRVVARRGRLERVLALSSPIVCLSARTRLVPDSISFIAIRATQAYVAFARDSPARPHTLNQNINKFCPS